MVVISAWYNSNSTLAPPARLRSVFQCLEGTKWGPKEWGLWVTTDLIVVYPQFSTCSNPHVDRCSNPLPWDTLARVSSTCTVTSHDFNLQSFKLRVSNPRMVALFREFKDVVFEDAVFDNNTCYLQFNHYYTYDSHITLSWLTTLLLLSNSTSSNATSLNSRLLKEKGGGARPIFILRILRPRIFESKVWNHCAKKLDGALRKPTSFV